MKTDKSFKELNLKSFDLTNEDEHLSISFNAASTATTEDESFISFSGRRC
jgi:hypothetical protein